MKQIVSMLLCLLMVLACLPGWVLAENETILTLDAANEVTVGYEEELMCAFTPEKSGYYRFYSVSDEDEQAILYDANGDELIANDDGEIGQNPYNFNLKYQLEAGKTYYLEVSTFSENDSTFDVYVTETVIAVSAEVITPPVFTELVKGYEEECISLTGLEVEFTLSDGTNVFWDANDEEPVADMKVITYMVEEDGVFSVDVCCDEADVNVPFTVIENPVKSITYKGEGLSFYENTHGYFDDYLEYYVYDYVIPWEDTLTVEYTDGTTKDYLLEDTLPYGDYTIADGQHLEAWKLGTNGIPLSYLGKTTQIPVNILPCPYKKVTVNSNPTAEVIFGDIRYGDVYEDVYYFTPYDLTGLSVTFELHDGSTETYTGEDFDLNWEELNGYPFGLSVVACDKPGLAEAALSYKGMDVPFGIPVVESPIANLEVQGIAKNLLYEDYYFPVLDGLSVKLTLKDGTSQTVELNEETVRYAMEYGFAYVVSIGEYDVTVTVEYDENDKEFYRFSCVDLIADYTDFSFKETREVENISISDFAPDGDGMILNIFYTNGQSDTLHVEKICENTMVYSGDYMGKTENGLMWYSIGLHFDENDQLDGYWVEVLNYEIVVKTAILKPGDVTGDKNIDAKDALQVLKFAVKKVEFTPVQEDCADVNKDGDVNAKDALEMLKFAVKKPSVLDEYYIA